MKKHLNKTLLVLLVMLFHGGISTYAQKAENKFSVKLSGFVKNDFFFDSRETVAAREGHFLLWPTAESIDVNGHDINAKSNFNFLAIQSRLKVAATGPDAFGAKTLAVIEADFFGQANDNINLFRLRLAFIKLNWKSTELLTGQYWNPLFVTGCFPGTVSFNTGTPFQSFARNPQIRITQHLGGLQFIVAAVAQRDFTSRGPDPVNNAAILVSSEFLRNSNVPDLHFQIHYGVKNAESNTDLLVGAGVAYKTIVPRLYSVVGTQKYQVDEKVGGLTAMVFARLKLKAVTLKLQGRYGENITDLLAVSGFAVKSVEDTLTGKQSYTPIKGTTVWGEIHTNGQKIQVGIFAGYHKNQGTKEEMSSAANMIYGFGNNIESMYRISPRVVFFSNKLEFACELEYTSANFGSNYDVHYIPADISTTANMRVLLSAKYNF
ncbi:MAG: hypothetical protein K9G61_02795 [Bacteroidales bacterium]|nr:hypothetical protein [Bacteroidales bacterium]